MNLRRVTIVFGVLAVLVQADGLWMEVTNYNGPNTGNLFGDQSINLSEGEVALISSGFLMLAAVVMTLVVFSRKSQRRAG